VGRRPAAAKLTSAAGAAASFPFVGRCCDQPEHARLLSLDRNRSWVLWALPIAASAVAVRWASRH